MLSIIVLCSSLVGCQKESNEKPTNMEGEIVLNVYQETEWLTMAVELFEDKYPEVNINIQDFYNGVDETIIEGGGVSMAPRPAGKTKEDYALWLNTNLMSGSAGDVIITSEGLPVDKYRNMGVFEDLTPYLESTTEINEENYYMNIFEAYKMPTGALYQFPLSAMACPLFVFDKELVDETGLLTETEGKSVTWREALTLAENMYDVSELQNLEFPPALTILGNIFTKEVVASVDYENEIVVIREEQIREILEAFEEFEYYPSATYGDDSKVVFNLAYTPDVNSASFILNESSVAMQWKHSNGTVQLSPYFTTDFGINSQSEVKGIAWEFLVFLASEEVQTLPAFPNAGIHKKGIETRVVQYIGEDSGEKFDEVIAMMDGWIKQVTDYRAEDTDLIQIGDGILGQYLEGTLTEDEVIEEVEFRLNQYLSE